MILQFFTLYGQDLARLILGSLIGSAVTLYWSRRLKQETESDKVALTYIESFSNSGAVGQSPWHQLWLFQKSGALNLEEGRARELVVKKIKDRGYKVPGDGILMVKAFGLFSLLHLAAETGADLRKAGDVYLKLIALLKQHMPSDEV
jgi:hypothetical protein